MTLSKNWPKPFTSPPSKPKELIGYEDIHAQIVSFVGHRTGERIAIVGPGGAGKTAIAKLISENPEINDHFRDGILWAHPVKYVNEATLLGTWAESLGSDLSRVSKAGDRSAAIRSLLYNKRVLIILDGVKDAQQISALACGGPHSATIVVTRDEHIAQSFAGPSGIWRLEGWGVDQAVRYLASQVDSIDWEEVLEEWFIRKDGFISPLSLKLIAGNLAAQRIYPDVVACPDTNPQGKRIAGLVLPELDFRASEEPILRSILAWCLATLPVKLQSVFGSLLALAPDPDSFSPLAAYQVANATDLDLDILVACNLLQRDDERLTIPCQVSEALSRKVTLANQKEHRRYYLEILTSSSASLAYIADVYGQSMYTCLLSRLEENRREIVNGLAAYQEEHGLWEDYRNCGELALQSCRGHSLCREEGRLCNNLGKAAHMLGDVQVAMSYYSLAEDLFGVEGDPIERALVMNNIASILVENGNLEEAQSTLLQAIPLLDDQEDKHIQAYLHNNLGKIYDDLNLPIMAMDEYQKALRLIDRSEDEELEMTVRFNLGLVYQTLGKKEAALSELKRAVDIEGKIDHPNFSSDLELLDRLRRELGRPKLIRWLRKKIAN